MRRTILLVAALAAAACGAEAPESAGAWDTSGWWTDRDGGLRQDSGAEAPAGRDAAAPGLDAARPGRDATTPELTIERATAEHTYHHNRHWYDVSLRLHANMALTVVVELTCYDGDPMPQPHAWPPMTIPEVNSQVLVEESMDPCNFLTVKAVPVGADAGVDVPSPAEGEVTIE